jgi:hypothetical protein
MYTYLQVCLYMYIYLSLSVGDDTKHSAAWHNTLYNDNDHDNNNNDYDDNDSDHNDDNNDDDDSDYNNDNKIYFNKYYNKTKILQTILYKIKIV